MENKEEFHLAPYHAVVSIFTNKENLDVVISSLKEAGFQDDQLRFQFGEEGLKTIDPDGSHHGFWGRLMRGYQRLVGTEASTIKAVELALKNGEYVLRVDTDGSDEMRDVALEAMQSQTDRTIIYFGSGTISVLKMGKNHYDPEKNYLNE